MNDSKNEQGAAKDRHENIGFGTIGFDALYGVTRIQEFDNTPIILETPYREIGGSADKMAPYKLEIAMLKDGRFYPNLFD